MTEKDMRELLNPFNERATEAEIRLSRLEAAIENNKDAGTEEHLKRISQLEAKLEDASSELALERNQVKLLTLENLKLRYRIIHLIRTIHNGDKELERFIGATSEPTAR